MMKAFALINNLCLSCDKPNPAGVAYPEHSGLRAWMTGRFVVVVVGKFPIKLEVKITQRFSKFREVK